MTGFGTALTAAAAAGAIAAGFAAPAAAQYYPPYPQPYPQNYPPGYYPQQQYGYGNQGTMGQIIDQLLGNRYNVTDRAAVSRCASVAVQQAQARYTPYGYDQGYPGQGYPGQGYAYSQRYHSIRVTAITSVERRSNGLRIRGLLDSGRNGYGNGYGYGYGNQGYPGQGYPNQGYGAQGYAYGDLTFRCTVDYRGYVSDVKIDRNRGY